MSQQQFYSPEDQLKREQSRLAYTSGGSSSSSGHASSDGNSKRPRLFYEGEPDPAKWAVPPAPDIFASHSTPPAPGTVEPKADTSSQPCFSSNTNNNGLDAESLADQPSAGNDADNDSPALQLDSGAIQQVQNLCMAQNDFERRLYEHRQRIQHEHEKSLKQLEVREIIGPVPQREKDELLRRHLAELERADKRAIEKLDDLRFQQQLELQRLGIPNMYQTSNIKVMHQQRLTLLKILKACGN